MTGIFEIVHSSTYTSKDIKNIVKTNKGVIWVGLLYDMKSIDLYINNGFNMPYITDRSPGGKVFKNKGLAFFRDSSLYKTLYDSRYLYDELHFRFQQEKCAVYVHFTNKSLEYFKDLLNKSKEISGALLINKLYNKGGNLYIELKEDGKVVNGTDEEVKAVLNRYNFHTHPYIAYTNNSVKNGWPSSNDFYAILQLTDTIFHVVISIEGIYIITFMDRVRITRGVKKFIDKQYDIDKNSKYSPEQFVDHVNNLRYHGRQIFNVIYRGWKNLTDKSTFLVYYDKTKDSCIVSQEKLDLLIFKN